MHQRENDALEVALDVMNDEKPSRLVNRKTKKIRPPKPVRSDFAEIITAKLRQRLSKVRTTKKKAWDEGFERRCVTCDNALTDEEVKVEMEGGCFKGTG